jgi:hypothetical protein
MRILFITTSAEDYLADGVLHGLRSLYGASVVDYPKAEPLYKNCLEESFARVRGRGFTLYRTLDDIPVDRHNIEDRLKSGEFDIVIFGNIYRSYHQFAEWRRWLRSERTLLLDGEDTQAIAPYAGKWWRNPPCWFWPKAHQVFPYFKREWGPGSLHYRTWRLVPMTIADHWYARLNLHPISFSIPQEKIVSSLPLKDQEFSTHVVDPEVASWLGRSGSYAFDNERAYYHDLQRSRFGITTRRAGWDCLRHYEIAANGAVPCFRDLNLKPTACAPHGLNEKNCITYSNLADLRRQIDALDASSYEVLRAGSQDWAKKNSTTNIAQFLIDKWRLINMNVNL